nr:hypothetical protein [Tanacetum cinerariifolium]
MYNNLQMRQQHKRVLTTRPACHPSLVSCLLSLKESLPSVPDAYEYPAAIAVFDVPGSGTRVHTPAHGGSKAHNEPPDSILSNEPKPLRKHRPPLLQSVWSPDGLFYPSKASRPAARPRANKHEFLRGGSSVLGISSLWSTVGGMYRGGGSGGSGGDDDGSNGDGIGGGDECADGAVHLARRSPAEGGDREVKEDPYVQRYQVMKKRPQTEAQARRNMIMYLKNVVGFRLDYFKGMSYDDIRPIFEAKFNSNIEFLLKLKEQIEEEENRAIESINETPAQKAAKRRKLNEEVKDVDDLKQHLEIVPDEDDDVYTKATLLVRKVPVVDYHIIQLNNKPRYKIIRADGTHQLAMFGRPYGQDQVWKSQRNVHGQAKLILLVERRYPLSRFTLDQMLNAVRLRVEEQSEMSLELISFGIDAAMELEEKH